MRTRHHGRPPARPAFTLIELLVVMSIMIVLATMVYFLLPGMLGREKASKGADLVQQWLLTAKQRALRDGLPRGVRLNVDSTSSSPTVGLVTTLNYIEKPADFSAGWLDLPTSSTPTPAGQPPNYTRFTVKNVSTADWISNPPVQPNDYLYIPSLDTGPWHLITAVNPQSGDTPPVPYIDIKSPGYQLTNDTVPTTPIQYMISRAPRLLAGEETLQMPQDVVIDMRPAWSVPSVPAGGHLDILFSPTGGLVTDPNVSAGTSAEKIILWVRDIPQNADPSAFPDPRGNPPGTPPTDPKAVPTEQTLIVIYARTGLIAAHPPAMNSSNPDLADPNNPYQFAQDGQSSGL